jgi:glycosyltransferase involved in cell wall biosynthesis
VLSTNPYQRLLYEHLEAHGYRVAPESWLRFRWLWRSRREVGVLHFHWPQSYWHHDRGPAALRLPLSYLKLGLVAARLAAARALGYRVVWTVHQVYPHDVAHPRLERAGARTLAAFSHVLIAHDESTRADASRKLGRLARSTAIVPHGSYVGVYAPGRPRDAVRAELGSAADELVFICFGNLRAYKDVSFLLDAFRATPVKEAALLVVGPAGDDGVTADVLAAAAADARVKPRLGYLPDDQVAEHFGAADVAIVARNDGGTSGAVVLALSLGVPVVAPRRPAYVELLGSERAGWLFEPGDRASLRAALERAAADGRAGRAAKAAAARERAAELNWPDIAARTAALIGGRANS